MDASTVVARLDDMSAAVNNATRMIADLLEAHVTHVEWVPEMAGAAYDDGVVMLGSDIKEMSQRCALGFAHPAEWWDLARIIAHECAHGRGPTEFGAIEEAAAETIGRAHAPTVLATLPGGPDVSNPPDWDAYGVYCPQVRWLARLASWLRMEPIDLALTLKKPRTTRRTNTFPRSIGALIAARVPRATPPDEQIALGTAIAATAGAVNMGSHVRPTSPITPLQHRRWQPQAQLGSAAS